MTTPPNEAPKPKLTDDDVKELLGKARANWNAMRCCYEVQPRVVSDIDVTISVLRQQLAEAQGACEVVRQQLDDMRDERNRFREHSAELERARQAVPEAVEKLRAMIVVDLKHPVARQALDELCRLAAPGAALREAAQAFVDLRRDLTFHTGTASLRFSRLEEALASSSPEQREAGAAVDEEMRARVAKLPVNVPADFTTSVCAIRRKSDGYWWECSSEHGAGWNDKRIRQAWTHREARIEVAKHLADEDVEIVELGPKPPAPQPVARRVRVGSPAHVALWNAINEVVYASGGRDNTSGARMNAVVNVEKAMAELLAEAPQPVERRDALVRLRYALDHFDTFHGGHLKREDVEAAIDSEIREIDRLAAGAAPLDPKYTFTIVGVPFMPQFAPVGFEDRQQLDKAMRVLRETFESKVSIVTKDEEKKLGGTGWEESLVEQVEKALGGVKGNAFVGGSTGECLDKLRDAVVMVAKAVESRK